MVLANMFEQYGIDYIVLEKHHTIAPQLGAGFALLPNGSRVLDQLGCYDVLKKLSAPVNSLCGYDQNGDLREDRPEIGQWLEELFVTSYGFPCVFLPKINIVGQIRI
jgi:2-polyprenyl-6-methoxyphenol hydroxylase-like FAD-dependent oxidoreductase